MQHGDSDFGFSSTDDTMSPSAAAVKPHITFYHIYLLLFFPTQILFFNFRHEQMTQHMRMTWGSCYFETFKAELSLVIFVFDLPGGPADLIAYASE